MLNRANDSLNEARGVPDGASDMLNGAADVLDEAGDVLNGASDVLDEADDVLDGANEILDSRPRRFSPLPVRSLGLASRSGAIVGFDPYLT